MPDEQIIQEENRQKKNDKLFKFGAVIIMGMLFMFAGGFEDDLIKGVQNVFGLSLTSNGTNSWNVSGNSWLFPNDLLLRVCLGASCSLDIGLQQEPLRVEGRINGSTDIFFNNGTSINETIYEFRRENASLWNEARNKNNNTINWISLNNYPNACASNNAITQLGDTITCSPFVTTETDPIFTGNNASIVKRDELNITAEQRGNQSVNFSAKELTNAYASRWDNPNSGVNQSNYSSGELTNAYAILWNRKNESDFFQRTSEINKTLQQQNDTNLLVRLTNETLGNHTKYVFDALQKNNVNCDATNEKIINITFLNGNITGRCATDQTGASGGTNLYNVSFINNTNVFLNNNSFNASILPDLNNTWQIGNDTSGRWRFISVTTLNVLSFVNKIGYSVLSLANSILGSDIFDGTITKDDLARNSINQSHVIDGSINGSKIQNNAVNASQSNIPVCSGTDKLTRTAGSSYLTCATDQTSAGASSTFYKLNSKNGEVYNGTIISGGFVGWNVSVFNMPVSANTNYTFDCLLFQNSTATTTGVQLNVTAPAGVGWLSVSFKNPTSATAYLLGSCVGDTITCTSLSTASTVAPLGSEIKGRLLNGANAGYINITMRSEITISPVYVLKESYCIVTTQA